MFTVNRLTEKFGQLVNKLTEKSIPNWSVEHTVQLTAANTDRRLFIGLDRVRPMSATTPQLVRFHISVLGGQRRKMRSQGEPVGKDGVRVGREKPGRPMGSELDVISYRSDMLRRRATRRRRHGANNFGMRFPCLRCLRGIR